MRGLRARLLASHLAVVAVGALTSYLVVRWLAPSLFDASLRGVGPAAPRGRGPGGTGPGTGVGPGLRDQFAAAVDLALLVGAVAGLMLAGVIGVWAAFRLARPLRRLGDATRQIAGGDYAVDVPDSHIDELGDLATDVRGLAQALAETEARRVRLLGEVAHEMRTPLTVIDGYVEGMIDGVLPAEPASLGQVSDEVRRLRRLSDDLSALSRAEEGRLAMRLRRTDLREVVARAGERLRPQAGDAGLTLTIETGERPVPVEADPDRIAQVVTNLVGNAIRATPPGGAIVLRCGAGGGEAWASVEDTGEGLAPADVERVFERFYRVPGRRTAGQDSGSGIGLTISRQIMRAHGGTLEAKTAGRERGCTFTARLPLAGGLQMAPRGTSPGD